MPFIKPGLMIKRLLIMMFSVALLAGPALAQPKAPIPPAPPAPVIDQQALGRHLRQSLMRCWSAPPGFDGRAVEIAITFMGDGSLTQEPEVKLDGKSAKKNEVLVQSITSALQRCTPFEGLRDFGLMAHQRFAINIIFDTN